MSGALYEFAKLIQPGDAIEYHPAEDGSASITALRDRTRVATLVVATTWHDGMVYDLSKIDDYLAGRPGYRVWPPEETGL